MMETLRFEVQDGVGVLTICRPRALNAIDGQVVAELTEVLTSQAGAGLSALIVTGDGDRAFVAGADIAGMSRMNPVEAEGFVARAQHASSLLESFPALTIAAVNGFALGGGCELAMCCDMILARANWQDEKGRTQGAVFGQPEVKLGVIPGMGGTQRLVRLVGRQRALELMATGRNVMAEEAVGMGLALEAVDGDVLERAMELARSIARNGPVALRLLKRAVHETDGLDLQSGLAAERTLFALCFATEDQTEGMSAFLEKRRAAFTGR
ncbi:MAG: enoyl-CoA hydratase-related protein [Myxococcota bacterium]|jgi:enoyl-CoA hydratase|nr:enoyl-CoA hydratase-related protein [Myxococcota bacterium]